MCYIAKLGLQLLAKLSDIRFRLSGLTRPMDSMAHDMFRDPTFDDPHAMAFLDCLQKSVSDTASHITQLLSDNVCKEFYLPTTPIVGQPYTESGTLLDTFKALAQTNLTIDTGNATSVQFLTKKGRTTCIEAKLCQRTVF
ncbi:hypothetical protein PHYBLDRAFT_68494 [Phycomyces blakesleeanus NRRL 1555(-)]|uniref:Uncharacterized protein n=1 Tax=Phycomyces blakesleeanus (strain ATCC 8743b / DSM 1359 / FGSC 10004 / NBRC 33097 / NRRL 1555) TaxID=763407 RepID=A0A162UU26_PHYB8|nr:hypothetical protein PHYBLDRAFT_68494 [Phycomyces blakesleeanus NRRL 1555(-)]OAD78003.1 hypothetical protein PHYBLDRAFT_68494 [Phycomyces blakesleeanus NRRL 1555(-)]|eukprot:XP_018296043.1 hypothetical protein PHYBLDRAFT_68494 [Phycomyces blakesleeanus NRRL 1555(-)]